MISSGPAAATVRMISAGVDSSQVFRASRFAALSSPALIGLVLQNLHRARREGHADLAAGRGWFTARRVGLIARDQRRAVREHQMEMAVGAEVDRTRGPSRS